MINESVASDMLYFVKGATRKRRIIRDWMSKGFVNKRQCFNCGKEYIPMKNIQKCCCTSCSKQYWQFRFALKTDAKEGYQNPYRFGRK